MRPPCASIVVWVSGLYTFSTLVLDFLAGLLDVAGACASSFIISPFSSKGSSLGKSASLETVVPGFNPPHTNRFPIESLTLVNKGKPACISFILFGKIGSKIHAEMRKASKHWYNTAPKFSCSFGSFAILNGSVSVMNKSTLVIIRIAACVALLSSKFSYARTASAASFSHIDFQSYPLKIFEVSSDFSGKTPSKYFTHIAVVRDVELPNVLTKSVPYTSCTLEDAKFASCAPMGPSVAK